MTTDGLRQWPGFGDVAAVLADPKARLWIDLTDPSADQVSRVTQLLGLHPLIAEDIVVGNQRAKIEVTDELVHIVMFSLSYQEQMIKNEIDFVLGDRFLLTVHTDDWAPRATHHLRDGVGPILKHGPDHLLWALVDALVDSYFPFIDKMGDEVDEIEDRVITKASSSVLATTNTGQDRCGRTWKHISRPEATSRCSAATRFAGRCASKTRGARSAVTRK